LNELAVIACTQLNSSEDPIGLYFKLDRANTGRGALGTLSNRTERVLVA
jgi:hypothetical protein